MKRKILSIVTKLSISDKAKCATLTGPADWWCYKGQPIKTTMMVEITMLLTTTMKVVIAYNNRGHDAEAKPADLGRGIAECD